MIPALRDGIHRPFVKQEVVQNLSLEFTDEPILNLIYHVFPVASNDRWKWNLYQILRRHQVFTGKRIIGIATDETTVTAQEVIDFIGNGFVDHYYVAENNPKLGEVATFMPMVALLPDGPNDVTFYAHTKSVRHTEKSGTAPMIWADVLYRLLLDDLPRVLECLTTHPVCCAFKNTGQFKCNYHSQCSPDGNFWFVRNHAWFNRVGFTDIPLMWTGVEMALSRVFDVDEFGTIFAEYHEDGSYMYKLEAWKRFAPLLAERGVHISFA